MMKNRKINYNDYGEPTPYDPTFSGPVKKRGFTDVVCCLIFFAAMVGYLILGGAAWLYGNPKYIIKQQNSSGEFCGSGSYIDKPSLFYFDVLKCAAAKDVSASNFKGLQCPTTQVCVKTCPSSFWFLPPEAFIVGAKPSDFFQQEFCDPSLDLARTTLTVQEILKKGLCPSYYMPSKEVQGKCLPNFDPKDIPSDFSVPGLTMDEKTLKNIMDATEGLRTGFHMKSITVRIIEDLALSWYWILIGLVITLVASMVLILLMRLCMGLMVVLVLIGVLSVGAFGIYKCTQGYQAITDSQHKLSDLSLQSKMSEIFQVKEIWLAFVVILSILEFIMLILIVSCLRRGFMTALSLMNQCSKAMGAMFSIMAFPLITFLLVVLCVSFCVMSSINLATSGPPVFYKVSLDSSNPDCFGITGDQPCDPKTFKPSDYPKCPVRCVFTQYDEDDGFFHKYGKFLQIYIFLACLWCLHFIITLSQCTLARTFSTYYWSLSKPQTIRRSTVSKALFQILRYHTGSLAFGAVFVNMFQGVRIVLQYLKKITKGGPGCGSCRRLLTILMKPGFFALDIVIKYFNRHTYVMMGVYGDNFFGSARKACMLVGRNKDRVRMVDHVTDLLLFFTRLLVVGATGVLAYCFFCGELKVSTDIFQPELLHFCWLPILILMFGSYFIALGCFSVYSMGVDTFTLCVMEDLERHDGTFQRPYMSRSLMELLRVYKDSDV